MLLVVVVGDAADARARHFVVPVRRGRHLCRRRRRRRSRTESGSGQRQQPAVPLTRRVGGQLVRRQRRGRRRRCGSRQGIEANEVAAEQLAGERRREVVDVDEAVATE